jgi:hypothetical protein
MFGCMVRQFERPRLLHQRGHTYDRFAGTLRDCDRKARYPEEVASVFHRLQSDLENARLFHEDHEGVHTFDDQDEE